MNNNVEYGILNHIEVPYKVYGKGFEYEAVGQFVSAMILDCTIRGALMPDAHLGYSLPIGGVVSTRGIIFPSWVGYDIGCGVCAIKTTFKYSDVVDNKKEIFDSILKAVPVGKEHNKLSYAWKDSDNIPKTKTVSDLIRDGAMKQIGTLGGGNHFIEIGIDEDTNVWVVIHSGSRNLGWKTAQYYMKTASGTNKAKEGHYGFPIDSEQGKNYIMDLNYCLEFALKNRTVMLERIEVEISNIIKGSFDWESLINRTHNHAEIKGDEVIHRKGATHAEDGMYGVVPGNMLDGSFIVRGKGNVESLCSSSHGAGRKLSRKEAKRVLDFEKFKEEMNKAGIEANVSQSTLDESRDAYKDIFKVMEDQKDLIDIVHYIEPIINVKG